MLLHCILFVILGFLTSESFAQTTKPLNTKKLNSSSDSSLGGSAAYGFDTTFSELMESKNDLNNYEPHTLWLMESLTDITQPFWDPYDVDYERNNRAVEKASTIHGGRYASILIKGSELKTTFDSFKRELDYVKGLVKYSLQADGSGLLVSKTPHGSKLIEMNLEFNLSQGLDPQLRIGKRSRLRYDIINKRTMLEYGLNF